LPSKSYDLKFCENNFRSQNHLPMVTIPGACAPPRRGRQRFTEADDLLLRQLVLANPMASWTDLASRFSHTGRQVRERSLHYLAPPQNQAWTDAEDDLLAQQFELLGPRWSRLTTFFPGKTAGNIKNRWTTLIARSHKAKWEQKASHPATVSADSSSDLQPVGTTGERRECSFETYVELGDPCASAW
jgi:hypothetical protein